jgi:transposase
LLQKLKKKDRQYLKVFYFLEKYFRQEHSESGFSADKRCDGWKIWQRKDDRMETATMCKGVWHNLLWLGGGTTLIYVPKPKKSIHIKASY